MALWVTVAEVVDGQAALDHDKAPAELRKARSACASSSSVSVGLKGHLRYGGRTSRWEGRHDLIDRYGARVVDDENLVNCVCLH